MSAKGAEDLNALTQRQKDIPRRLVTVVWQKRIEEDRRLARLWKMARRHIFTAAK
jgi:hypothetical protein